MVVSGRRIQSFMAEIDVNARSQVTHDPDRLKDLNHDKIPPSITVDSLDIRATDASFSWGVGEDGKFTK